MLEPRHRPRRASLAGAKSRCLAKRTESICEWGGHVIHVACNTRLSIAFDDNRHDCWSHMLDQIRETGRTALVKQTGRLRRNIRRDAGLDLLGGRTLAHEEPACCRGHQ